MESDPAASVELRNETFPCRRSHLAGPPGPACPNDNVAANALFGAYQGYGDKPYNSPRDQLESPDTPYQYTCGFTAIHFVLAHLASHLGDIPLLC